MNIKIAIATNINFYKKSLPIVIESLLKNGIDKDLIYVFNAGFDTDNFEIIDGIKHYYLPYNSFEYSALIAICEQEIESDYWFLLHDTCKVGDDFLKIINDIPDYKPEKIALCNKPAMSMGLYKYDYLLSIKNKLFSIKNSDYSIDALNKWKLWGVPNEDFILWLTDPQPILSKVAGDMRVVDYENWFDSNTIRRTEYHPGFDIYKNKSNWGQTGDNMVLTL